jgi:FtsZ-binding cell division protein ZapB
MDIDALGLDDDKRQQLQAFIADQAKQIAAPIVEEEVTGLKNKNSELLGKVKTLQQTNEELSTMQQQTQDPDEMLRQENKALAGRIDELRSEIGSFVKQGEEAKKREVAGKIAARLTKDTRKGELLQKELLGLLTLVEGEVKVLDSNGQVSAQTLDELEGSARDSYDFLVDGIQSQGGGAVRTEGEAQKPNEMSGDEWRAMSSMDKALFLKNGGTLID